AVVAEPEHHEGEVLVPRALDVPGRGGDGDEGRTVLRRERGLGQGGPFAAGGLLLCDGDDAAEHGEADGLEVTAYARVPAQRRERVVDDRVLLAGTCWM